MVKPLHVSPKESSSLKASSRFMVSIPASSINKPCNLRLISQLSWALISFLGYKCCFESLKFFLDLKKHLNYVTTEINVI